VRARAQRAGEKEVSAGVKMDVHAHWLPTGRTRLTGRTRRTQH